MCNATDANNNKKTETAEMLHIFENLCMLSITFPSTGLYRFYWIKNTNKGTCTVGIIYKAIIYIKDTENVLVRLSICINFTSQ